MSSGGVVSLEGDGAVFNATDYGVLGNRCRLGGADRVMGFVSSGAATVGDTGASEGVFSVSVWWSVVVRVGEKM